MNQPGHIYRLDGLEVDASRVCVKRDGEERHLRQKTFQVLRYLLEHRERLVTKDELIESIWADTAVTDNALEQCLAEIRRTRHSAIRRTARSPLLCANVRIVCRDSCPQRMARRHHLPARELSWR